MLLLANTRLATRHYARLPLGASSGISTIYRGIPPTSTTVFASRFTRHLHTDKVIEDSVYPGLFHHVCRVDNDDTYQTFVSFLRKVPATSLTTENKDGWIIGWMRNTSSSINTSLSPDNFVECQAFRHLLNDVINEQAPTDQQLMAQASYQQEGWLHVPDERNPAPWGRIPDPEDIFGSVQLKNGTILPNSFQPMPTHRMVSSNGLFRLGTTLHAALLRRLKSMSLSS